MTYSTIGILASILLLIINQDIVLNRGRDTLTKTQRTYRLFLMGVLVYLITDLLWGILDSHHLIGLLFADTSIHFAAMIVRLSACCRWPAAFSLSLNWFLSL